MKFKIMTNGEHWRVQKKTWFGWKWITKPWGCMEYSGNSPREFISYQDAEAFIIKIYGTSSTFEKPWIVQYPSE